MSFISLSVFDLVSVLVSLWSGVEDWKGEGSFLGMDDRAMLLKKEIASDIGKDVGKATPKDVSTGGPISYQVETVGKR